MRRSGKQIASIKNLVIKACQKLEFYEVVEFIEAHNYTVVEDKIVANKKNDCYYANIANGLLNCYWERTKAFLDNKVD